MRYIQFTQPFGRTYAPIARFGGRFGDGGLENEIDQLVGTFAGATQFPVDLYQDKDNTYVRAELPGANRDSINVEIVDGSLSIKASRQQRSAEGEETVSVGRLVSIQDQVQTEKVSATYENGVLTVTLPRQEESKPRKINVSVN